MRFLTLLCITFSLFYTHSSHALETDENISLPSLTLEYKENIHLSETLKIDTSEIKNVLQQDSWENTLDFQWDIKWRSSRNGLLLEEKFDTPWVKEVTLSIYENSKNDSKLLFHSQIEVFVYEKSIGLAVSDTIWSEKIQDTIARAKEKWILIVLLFTSKEKNIPDISINEIFSNFRKEYIWYGDYMSFWGEKEFLFSCISKINQEQDSFTKKSPWEKIVLLSEFNTDILKSYLSNLVADKPAIKEILLLEESLIYQVEKHPSSFEELKSSLKQNQFHFQELSTKEVISPVFFLSRFINNLSHSGVTTSDIYMILMIPLLLTLTSFIKHFVGFSPIGISLPLFCSLLCFKLWVLFFIVLFLITFCINLWLSYTIGRYNLLYTPKLIFLSLINLLIFILFFNFWQEYLGIRLSPSDSLYIVLYIVLAEKFIHLVISKEFREYKKNIYATFFIWILWYFILTFESLRVFLLAYPEIIILFVPINFMIWRFTWLRITEYLRFKEVIKNIEEE